MPPNTHETYGVTSSNVCIPVGLVFLVRKGDQRAAIRFIEVRSLKEQGTGYATYEYYPDDTGVDFTVTGKRVDTVSVLGWGGFHPFSYRKGDARLHAGSITLEYNFPSCISFTPYGRSSGDHGVEIAPTRWTRIQDVNVSDPTLRWFRYDAAGERHLEIRPEDL